jgi:hypothetical protein
MSKRKMPRKRTKKNIVHKQTNEAPTGAGVVLENNIFNYTLFHDQLDITAALFSAALYINHLENKLGIELHKDMDAAINRSKDYTAKRYYQAMQTVRLHESRYLPQDPDAYGKNCYRPWTDKTMTEDLVSKEKWLVKLQKLESELAKEV